MGSHEPTMQSAALVLALALGLVSGDGLGHAHGSSHSGRRSGRQEAPAVGYEQPPAEYGADQAGYDADAAASDADAALAMLQGSIPGVPGEDYPIYAEVPESGFGCEGQVDGGYYADPEAECQAFHICTADGAGGLAKYSFLCPNGTLFNQNYFICDWWFNFDCSTAEELYSLNDEIAAERDALAGAGADAPGDYAAPPAEYGAEGSGAPAYEAPPGGDVTAEGGVKHLLAPNVPSPVLVNNKLLVIAFISRLFPLFIKPITYASPVIQKYKETPVPP